jgi:hypothetical protein
MEIQDDRTEQEKITHNNLIIMTDSCLSNWGKAEDGKSYAAWACTAENQEKVYNWVKSRGEAKRVREVYEYDNKDRWRPRGKGHAHIYVVRKGHTALGGNYGR